MKSLLYLIVLTLLATSSTVQAQIGLNGPAHSSAVLDLKSPDNNKAFYPPRLTTAQRRAIINPQAGAFVYDLDKGTMYLHDGQNWLPLAPANPRTVSPVSRTASDGGGYDYFGSSVAIDGNYAIVGASTKFAGTNAVVGAAYIFVRSGIAWSQQQRVIASDVNTADGFANFGRSVFISGDYALIGAPGKSVGGNAGQGAAYVFLRSGSNWSQQQRITGTDGSANDNFGYSVATDDQSALVGAYGKSINGNANQGSAYVFTRSGTFWSQQQRLTAADGAAGDYFGRSVALSGTYAVVGAYNKSFGTSTSQGSAYLFNRSGTLWA